MRAGAVKDLIRLLVIESQRSACQDIQADMPLSFARSGHPGLHIVSVPSLDEAEARLRNEDADAILLDQRDVAGLARLQASTLDRPILAVTAEGGIAAACDAITAGVDDVLRPQDLARGGLERRVALAIARKEAARQRPCHARRDGLTGLANSILLQERFARALARADRYATLVGLVAINLDGFDEVIARHGQAAADGLFSLAGQRLLGKTRQVDTLARTRDHGFTWLVEGLATIGDVSALVNRLPEQLAQPFSIGDQDISLTASIGIAICPCHGRDFQIVHGMAEAAMLDVSTISGDALLMLPVSQPMRSAALT